MSVWFLSLSCAMISCYNVSKLPICEEGKQRSPWGVGVDFLSFPSGATFTAEMRYIQKPGSGLMKSSAAPLVRQLGLCAVSPLCQQCMSWLIWGSAAQYVTLLSYGWV